MRIQPKNVRRFQEGGMVEDPAMAGGMEPGMEGGAPAPELGGQDPIMMLALMAMQALQSQDCNLAMQVCEGFVLLIQQAQGGGGAPAPEGEPVYRKGGKLAYRIRK